MIISQLRHYKLSVGDVVRYKWYKSDKSKLFSLIFGDGDDDLVLEPYNFLGNSIPLTELNIGMIENAFPKTETTIEFEDHEEKLIKELSSDNQYLVEYLTAGIEDIDDIETCKLIMKHVKDALILKSKIKLSRS